MMLVKNVVKGSVGKAIPALTIRAASGTKNKFHWDDPFLLRDQLTEDERTIYDGARSFCDSELLPGIINATRKEHFDVGIMKKFGEMGYLGPTIHGYGCAGVGYNSYGLIANAVERVDSGYRSAMSVQSSLVMWPIYNYGSEEQKEKYLPELAKGNLIGKIFAQFDPICCQIVLMFYLDFCGCVRVNGRLVVLSTLKWCTNRFLLIPKFRLLWPDRAQPRQ